MSPSSAAVSSGLRTGLLIATYSAFRRLGFDDPVAANLTAVSAGVPIGMHSWSVGELTHLAFLRELRGAHAAWSGADDRAVTEIGDDWRLPPQPSGRSGQFDGRVTLLTILRSIAGPHASSDFLRLAGMPGPDLSGDDDDDRR